MRRIHLSALRSAAWCLVVPPLVASCASESNPPGGASDPLTSPSTTSGTDSSSAGSDTSTSTGANPSTSTDATTTTSADETTSTQPSTSDSDESSAGDSTSSGEASTSASSSETSDGTSSQADTSDTEVTGSDSSATDSEGTATSDTAETDAGATSSDDPSPTSDAPVPSAGCGKADGLQTLTAGGASVGGGLPTSTRLSIGDREYIIDVPADYDASHPYRLIFSWHQAFGSANGNAVGQYPAYEGNNFNAQNYAYFGLHREATAANQPAIFVAPQGIGDFPWNYDRDVALFDDLLALVGENLCIDESRVFSTGFSFGAMMSHALSNGRQSKLRAVVAMAPANYNFTQPPDTNAPFAYFGVTGMSDGTCPWVNGNSTSEGGKYCVLQHADNSGCTIPNDIATAMNGSNNHVCYDFEGCAEGYPVKVCTFDGAHTPSAVANGMSGDDGLNAFVPPLAWEFISQF